MSDIRILNFLNDTHFFSFKRDQPIIFQGLRFLGISSLILSFWVLIDLGRVTGAEETEPRRPSRRIAGPGGAPDGVAGGSALKLPEAANRTCWAFVDVPIQPLSAVDVIANLIFDCVEYALFFCYITAIIYIFISYFYNKSTIENRIFAKSKIRGGSMII